MTPTLSEIELDALRELANIASGSAATSLSQMLGRPVELNIPRARTFELGPAVEAIGPPEEQVCAVILPVTGDSDAIVLLLIAADAVTRLSELLGVPPGSEVGDSALCEIGNILGASYLRGLSDDDRPGDDCRAYPASANRHARGDPLLVCSSTPARADSVLILDSELVISGKRHRRVLPHAALPAAASRSCSRRWASSPSA